MCNVKAMIYFTKKFPFVYNLKGFKNTLRTYVF